jgi:hypothetical protein
MLKDRPVKTRLRRADEAYRMNWRLGPSKTVRDHLKAVLTPQNSITLIDDIDVHNNAIMGFDVIFLFHQEYVTSEEYQNLKSFVSRGGKLVIFDGNVFFAQITYNPVSNSITLVDGHSWHFDGKAAYGGPEEHNKSGNIDFIGAYTSLTYLMHYADYAPFRFRRGEEEVSANPANMVIREYGEGVATFVKSYGSGLVLVMGLYGDIVDVNMDQDFLNFLDSLLSKYLGLSVNVMLPGAVKTMPMPMPMLMRMMTMPRMGPMPPSPPRSMPVAMPGVPVPMPSTLPSTLPGLSPPSPSMDQGSQEQLQPQPQPQAQAQRVPFVLEIAVGLIVVGILFTIFLK